MRNKLKFAITSASLLINNNIYFHHKWIIATASSTNDSNKPISLSKRKNLLNNQIYAFYLRVQYPPFYQYLQSHIVSILEIFLCFFENT